MNELFKEIYREENIEKDYYFLKGIIHITSVDESNNEIEYEVLEEEFFSESINSLDSYYLSNQDFDVTLQYSLKDEGWKIEPKINEVYSVLWKFEMEYSKSWTDCGYEHDSEIITKKLKFNKLENYFEDIKEEKDFQFTE